ncbi:MAG: prolipoprotein diacylglyceryl transferase [Firmicutes bacterium]|nr:prolipoprotein diacylglyceryl transferase [Bacillota bacterium]
MGRQLPTYGLCLVCGALLAGLIALALGRRCHAKSEDVIFCGMYAAIGALIGAKAGFLLAHAGEIFAAIAAGAGARELAETFISGGFLSFGAMAGAMAGFLLYCREFGVDRDKLACCLLPTAPLMLACCRLGCFAAGCCYGIPWQGPLAIVDTVSPVGLNGVPLFPVQLFSVTLGLLLFAVMLAWPGLRWPAPLGRLLGLFLTLYSAGRFGLEFFRGDHLDRGWLGLTWSQWFCLAAFIAGAVLWLRCRRPRAA